MPFDAAIPETERHRVARRTQIRRLVRIWKLLGCSQVDVAKALGVVPGTLSDWLGGRRVFGQHVVHDLAETTIETFRGTDDEAARVEAEVVEILLLPVQVRPGRWVPDDSGPVGPYAEEAGDVVEALAGLRSAIRGASREAVVAAARKLVDEAEEAARAAAMEAK